ncbi:MAG TPA: glycoside hydrolase family 3 N-terminal domain-containing protein, partial [Polyangiales bacterium]
AHVVFDALTDGRPATLSRAVVTDLLRGELGFEGLVLTDDMEMKAIADHFGVESAACAAIEAGCDQLLICSRLPWLERAHAALVERAERDLAFRARLADAAARSLATRRRRPPRPITEKAALDQALAPDETEALARELSLRLARISHGS